MIKKIILNLLYLSVCFYFSCNGDDPTDLGYFAVDGEKHIVDAVAFYPSADPVKDFLGQNVYETEVDFGGKEDYYYIEIYLLTPTQIMEEGTYTFEFNRANLSKMEISYCAVTYGNLNSLSVYSSALPNSGDEVTLVVKAGKGNNFTLDLTALIDGHEVTGHFKGNVQIFEPI